MSEIMCLSFLLILCVSDVYGDLEDYIRDTRIYQNPSNLLLWKGGNILSALEFQINFCSEICVGNDKVTLDIKSRCTKVKCAPCDCDKPSCLVYGTCCPEFKSRPSQVIENNGTDFEKASQIRSITARTSLDFLDPIKKKTVDSKADKSLNNTRLANTFDRSFLGTDAATHLDSAIEIQGSYRQYNSKFSTRDIKATAISSVLTPKTVLGKTVSDVGVDEVPSIITELLNIPEKSVCDFPDLIVRSCPDDYHTQSDYDEETKRRCEHDVLPDLLIMDRFRRLTDISSNITFYNRYCAECNAVGKNVSWDVDVKCMHYQHVYQATSEDNLLQLTMDPRSACLAVHKEPEGFSAGKDCDPGWFGNIISSCNVTGIWTTYDVDLIWLCGNISGYVYRVWDKTDTFANIFCFMCNNPGPPNYSGESCGRSFTTYEINWGGAGGFIGPDLPLSMLLGGSARLKQRHDVPSIEEDDLHCAPGKVLGNKTCTTAMEQIRGLAYKFFVYYGLSLETDDLSESRSDFSLLMQGNVSSVLSAFASNVSETFQQDMSQYFMNSKLTVSMIHVAGQDTDDKSKRASDFLIYLSFDFTASMDYPRDTVEVLAVSKLHPMWVAIETQNHTLNFKPLRVDSTFDLAGTCNTGLWNGTKYTCQTITANDGIVEQYHDFEHSDFIHLTPLLTCPFVAYRKGDYSLIRNDQIPLSLTKAEVQHDGLTIEITAQHDDIRLVSEDRNKGELKVCLELVERLVDKSKQSLLKLPRLYFARYVVQMVSLSLSLLCLVLTLITFSTFASLRNVGGVNNMFLSGSLLTAQSLLLVIAHVKHSNTPLCSVLGVATHFSWLSTFSWNFVCCFHVFHTFNSNMRSSVLTGRAKMANILRKVAFCTCIPILVVIIVFAVSYALSEGSSIGYGKTACYLNTTLLAVTSVAIPLGLMVTANTVLFCITVYKIRGMRSLQSNRDISTTTHSDLYIYVKLSSVTGCFWSLALLGEFLGYDSFLIISDILNGFQGVFIFISYVCNKRVLEMYLKALGVVRYQDTSSQSAGTLTKLAKDADAANNVSHV